MEKVNVKKTGYLLFILMVLAGGLWAQGPLNIRAYVDKTTIAVNQQLMLTIEITGDGANKIDFPSPPDLGQYLRFAGSGGTSQNIQFINGKMSITKSASLFYIAATEGTVVINPIQITNKNDTAASEPIEITIVAAPAGSAPPASAPGTKSQPKSAPVDDNGEDLFIRTILSKKNVYQNEPVVVSYRIYKSSRVNMSNYGVSKMPETVGFWAEEIDTGNQPTAWEEVINGKKFLLADIKKTIMFPASPGKKTIGSLGVDCNIRVPKKGTSGDVFDSFFDDPFFSRTVKQTIYSQPVEVNVLPLPSENKPDNFSGLVGRFKMDASLDKNNVKTNEAITLKIKIAGTGNVKMIPTPVISVPKDFEQYDPKQSESINRDENGITGSKTFEYVLVPRFAGEQHIKPVSFAYFDAAERQYKVLTTPDFTIQVEKGNEDYSAIGGGLSKEEVRLVGQDIRFIKLNYSKLVPADYNYFTSFMFWSILLLPLAGLGGALAFNRHQVKLSGNIAYARSRRANTMAMKKLSKSKSLLSEKTQKEFYAEASRALLGFAADKLNLAEAGIISSELEELLRKRNLDEQVITDYLNLIQECDFQRFSSAKVTHEGMDDFYKKAKEAIINLEKAL